MPNFTDDIGLTPDEEKLLHTETELPPDADDKPDPDADPDTDPDDADDDGKPADKAAPAAPAKPADQDTTPDDDFAAFTAKHANKTPEELLRIAWQQNKARSEARRGERDARTAAQEAQARVAEIAERIRQAREAKAKELQERDRQFQEELKADPDAAAIRQHREALEREAREHQERHWSEFVEAQRSLTREAIPDFDEVQEAIVRYAIEERGYTPQEVMRAADHRDILTLDKARRFDALVKAGVIDGRGTFRAAPTPAAAAADRARQIVTSRTPANAPRSLSDARGVRPKTGTRALHDKASELLSLSDDDFSKLDPKELDTLLRELG
jgi:hypothetical protein